MQRLIAFLSRQTRVAIHYPCDLQHVFGVANSVAQEITNPETDIRSIPAVDISDIPGGCGRFIFQIFPGVGASITLQEAGALGALCRSVNAKLFLRPHQPMALLQNVISI
jgi:hypothetical protein